MRIAYGIAVPVVIGKGYGKSVDNLKKMREKSQINKGKPGNGSSGINSVDI
jgi:hypothetical protein